MKIETEVARHYGSGGIAARVLAALREAQGPDAPVTVDGLAPLDQFHGRGPLATPKRPGCATSRFGMLHILFSQEVCLRSQQIDQ